MDTGGIEDLLSTLSSQIRQTDWLATHTSDQWEEQNPETAAEYRKNMVAHDNDISIVTVEKNVCAGDSAMKVVTQSDAQKAACNESSNYDADVIEINNTEGEETQDSLKTLIRTLHSQIKTSDWLETNTENPQKEQK